MAPPLVSFHLASKHPEKLAALLDNLEATATDPSRIEVLVKIDEEDEAMNAFMEGQSGQRLVRLRHISTPRGEGYFGLWSAYNDLIAICDPEAYFVALFNDEVWFLDKGWDDALERYRGFYPDHLFRLRISRYRLRNYRDFWECGYAPDAYAIYAKRWFEISGDWCPCNTPDSFQQCVAFYLWGATRPGPRNVQHNRDVPVWDIRLDGEAPYQGLDEAELKHRVHVAERHWFRLMSWNFQTEASKRAHKLLAYLEASAANLPDYSIEADEPRKLVKLIGRPSGEMLGVWRYALDRRRIVATNRFRKPLFEYWCGGSWEIVGIHLRQKFADQLGWFDRWRARFRRARWALTRLHRPGRVAGASSWVERHPPELLIDGAFDPWGSAETDDDTYVWIAHRRKFRARSLDLRLFSPGNHAHVRQVGVVASNRRADGTPGRWVMLRARVRETDVPTSYDYRVSVPADPDFARVTIEIDRTSPAYEPFDVWGLACLSTSRGDARNWLDEGRGIYLRQMTVR